MTTRLLCSCGHRVWIAGKDRRMLTIVDASTDRERAKQRHPSAHADVCGSRLAGTVEFNAGPYVLGRRSKWEREPGREA